MYATHVSWLLVCLMLFGLTAPALAAEQGARPDKEHRSRPDWVIEGDETDDDANEGETVEPEPDEGDEPDLAEPGESEPRPGPHARPPSLPNEEDLEPAPPPDVPPLRTGPAEPASASQPQGIDQAPPPKPND